MAIVGSLALMLLIAVFLLTFLALKLYGIILCFKKKWYFGVIALCVPLFGEIVGVARFFFKKDLLK